MAKITFKTELDNSGLEKDLKKTKSEIEREEKSIAKNEAAKLPLTEQMNELSAAVEEAAQKLNDLERKKKSIASTLKNGADPEAYAEAFAEKKQVDKDYTAQEKETERLQKKWESVANKVDSYDAKIKASTDSISANKEKAGQIEARLSSGGHKLGEAMERASDSATRFERRIISLGKRVFIFTLITAALRSARDYMGKLLSVNEEYRDQLARLKGALMTAFQPIYEFILPGLLAVLRVITNVVQVVANVLSMLTGKTAKQSADAAESLNKEADAIGGVGAAAKQAQKDLAGFDEINKLSSTPDVGGGGGGIDTGIKPNFDEWDNEEYKQKIDELTVRLSGALLALGAILAFSGVNMPLGIALMAAGAIGLVAVAKENWDGMSDGLREAITKVMVILGGAMLVIGAVLAFSGVSIVKGIALMALGAASLGGAAALNWNSIVTALQGPFGKVMAIASGGLLVLGIIMCFSGVALPLGLGLMVAGGAGLAAVAAANWDFISDKVKEIWGNVKAFWAQSIAPVFTVAWWQGKFSSIGEGLKGAIRSGINAAIGLINRFTSWISSVLSFSIPPVAIAGKEIFGGFSTSVNIPQIPMLAKGAVLPANNPFLAVVGDQSSGTNIEAPIDTIKQALAEVLAERDDNTEIVDLLRAILAKCGVYIDGEKLSSMVTRYQREAERAGG